jgi:RimJ/RimL family protein N-acetyltransferase
MKPIPSMEGERLMLRPFTLADAPEVQRLAGDFEIADTTAAIPHPYEDGMAEQWISGHGAEFESGRGVTFAVTQKSDGALVGAISLMGMSAGHQAEMGYWIGVPYWNRGYCTEAARTLLRYSFGELGLVRVHACHFARNPSSGRVMQKLGMQYEGTRRKHVKRWDLLEDLVLYGILKEDWERTANGAAS